MFGMIIGVLFGLYVIAAVIHIVGVIIGAVFSGVGAVIGGIFSAVFSLVEGIFSAEGLLLGFVLGLGWYLLRKRNAAARSNA